MTPNAQRIAIAEATGLEDLAMRVVGDEQSVSVYCLCSGTVGMGGLAVPNYLHDLNAMHEVEKTLQIWQIPAYFAFMRNCLAPGARQRDPIGYDWICVHANAEHRAEAFLRTVGKWDDSK